VIAVLKASALAGATALLIGAICAGLAVAQEEPADDIRVYEMKCAHQPQGPRATNQPSIDRSGNERVAAALMEDGDTLANARPIQHWAYFSTDESRAEFIALLEQQFSGIDPHTNPMSVGKEYAVTFWHTGTPDSDSMTKVTSILSRAAESCGGEYDGWETQVVR
jgi:hypothetical protein